MPDATLLQLIRKAKVLKSFIGIDGDCIAANGRNTEELYADKCREIIPCVTGFINGRHYGEARRARLQRFAERFNTYMNSIDLVVCADRVELAYHQDAMFFMQHWYSREYCRRNVVTCSSCGNDVFNYNTQYVEGSCICSGCFAGMDVGYCEYNGEYVYEPCNNSSCDTCNPREDRMYHSGADVTRQINNCFLSLDSEVKPLWLGLEMETMARDGDRDSALGFIQKHLSNHAIPKEDGSLPDDTGIEIVTIPASMAYHKRALNTFLNTANSHLKAWHTGCCGMHIHVDKEWFEDDEARAKFVLFWHYQNSKHIKFLTTMAGRDLRGSRWCVPKMKTREDALDASGDRYESCNTTGNDGKTFEVRIFRGNISKDGVFRNMEFVDSVAKWAKQTKDSMELSYEVYLEWLADKSDIYPVLVAYLAKHNYLAATPNLFTVSNDQSNAA